VYTGHHLTAPLWLRASMRCTACWSTYYPVDSSSSSNNKPHPTVTSTGLVMLLFNKWSTHVTSCSGSVSMCSTPLGYWSGMLLADSWRDLTQWVVFMYRLVRHPALLMIICDPKIFNVMFILFSTVFHLLYTNSAANAIISWGRLNCCLKNNQQMTL